MQAAALEVVAELTPEQAKAAARETWVDGSIPKLRRSWGGRCLTCDNWSPTPRAANLGDCSAISATGHNKLINIGPQTAVVTAAEFGCLLWQEITPVMTEVVIEHKGKVEIVHKELSGPIRERTEHAIALTLIPDVPDETNAMP